MGAEALFLLHGLGRNPGRATELTFGVNPGGLFDALGHPSFSEYKPLNFSSSIRDSILSLKVNDQSVSSSTPER